MGAGSAKVVSMVQRTVVLLEDDIDGSDADESVTFALDGVTYEIDLTAENAETLREVFYGYIRQARKVGKGRPARKTTVSASGSGATAAEIRVWGRENGYTVPDRGRIPADVRAAFDATT